MAVFTPVSTAQAQSLAQRLGVGELRALEPIGAGIENTNYFLSSSAGDWVLTLFERLAAEQLPYYLGLMQHLARQGLPVPEPHGDAQGRLQHQVAGKPAALVRRLSGMTVSAPDLHHCGQLGAMLARLHLGVADFGLQQPNLRGLAWWQATAPQVLGHLAASQVALLSDELAFAGQVAGSPAFAALPRGAVHADLFRDNVLFDGLPGHEKLTGCLDFYFAGDDAFVFDLAVCLNDWCVDDGDGRPDEARAQALVAAYERVRPLSSGEQRLLPALLRSAALRFWLSRLADLHLPRRAALLQAKDPAHFERILRHRASQPWHPQR